MARGVGWRVGLVGGDDQAAWAAATGELITGPPARGDSAGPGIDEIVAG